MDTLRPIVPTQPSRQSIDPETRPGRRRFVANWRLLVLLLVLMLATSLLIACVTTNSDLAQHSPAPQEVIPISSPTVTPLSDRGLSPIDGLPLWAPEIQWQDPKPTMDVADDKPVGGISRTGKGISPIYVVPDIHPVIHEELTKQGWETTYPADYPGSSLYRYIKNEQGKQRVIYLGYKTMAAVISASGEDIRFAECPCPYELTVFYSDPY